MKLVVIILAGLCLSGVHSSFSYGTYFPAWAQYREKVGSKNYAFVWSDLVDNDIVESLDYVIYSFAYMDSPAIHNAYPDVKLDDFTLNGSTFQIFPIETQDISIWQSVSQFKQDNPDTKTLVSVGGWNFPSSDFSKMVSSSATRALFIDSCLQTMDTYGFDGIDIDWESPNSNPRVNSVKISCDDFLNITDQGGQASDYDNFLVLIQEMREAFGQDKLITYAAPADIGLVSQYDIKTLSQYVDRFHLMVYDYFVSDVGEDDDWAKTTFPNQPLYGVPEKPEFSVSSTVGEYLSGGAQPQQLSLGLAYYGHSWNIGSEYKGTSFAEYNLPGNLGNGCCGPFSETYGAQYGPVVRLCGTLGYSEIVDVYHDDFVYVEDNATMTGIGYSQSDGTWVSFNTQKSLLNLVSFAKSLELGGVFLFDISMDLKNDQDQWSFMLSKILCVASKGAENCPMLDSCLNDCSDNGKCQANGVCSCDQGFNGDDCSFYFCDSDDDCSGHGVCSTGVCSCDSGYYGDDCSQQGSASCRNLQYGYECEDAVHFHQCFQGSVAAEFSCPATTTCQCEQASGSPCGTSSTPASCLQ